MGRLIARHYGAMVAVAKAMLGPGSDAEDACQSAVVAAMSRIADLRNPEAVGPWLKAIVRNSCRDVLRARQASMLLAWGLAETAPDESAEAIEQQARRDWTWHALTQLTPAVYLVAILRYFTENNSYEAIAQLCGIPVGTVRSRLSEARRQLTEALERTADDRHPDLSALVAERRQEAVALLSSVRHGASLRAPRDRWPVRTPVTWSDRQRSSSLSSIHDMMAKDHAQGLRYRLRNVVAAPGVTVWELDSVPGSGRATTVLLEEAGKACTVRIALADRRP